MADKKPLDRIIEIATERRREIGELVDEMKSSDGEFLNPEEQQKFDEWIREEKQYLDKIGELLGRL